MKKDVNVMIKIDGKIDEPEWQDITSYDPYKVTKPETLADTSYESNLRFFYTANGFYISMDMKQPKDTLVKRFKPRDDWQTQSDKTGFSIDTSGENFFIILIVL